MRLWRPDPDAWKGRTIAILAGGPSLTPQAVERVRHLDRIVINDSWRLAPDAQVLYAADLAWWQAHPDAQAFAGLKLCAQRVGNLGEVQYIPPRAIGGGGNSALRAAHLASDAGARRILLLGVDLDPARLTHWHGLHGHGLRNPSASTFERVAKAWQRFAADPARPEVINCNPASRLDCFTRLTLDDALAWA